MYLVPPVLPRGDWSGAPRQHAPLARCLVRHLVYRMYLKTIDSLPPHTPGWFFSMFYLLAVSRNIRLF